MAYWPVALFVDYDGPISDRSDAQSFNAGLRFPWQVDFGARECGPRSERVVVRAWAHRTPMHAPDRFGPMPGIASTVAAWLPSNRAESA